MEDFFCIIENEQKAFEIVKAYNKRTLECKTEDCKLKALHNLDNEIQSKEIETHILINKIPEEGVIFNQLQWVEKYGESFRSYLNTLKIIFVSLKAKNTDFNSLDFEDFCLFKDRINNNKAFLKFIHD